jgi:hypothetical protein
MAAFRGVRSLDRPGLAAAVAVAEDLVDDKPALLIDATLDVSAEEVANWVLEACAACSDTEEEDGGGGGVGDARLEAELSFGGRVS